MLGQLIGWLVGCVFVCLVGGVFLCLFICLFVCLFEGKKRGLFSSEKPQEPRRTSNPTRSPYGEVTSEDRPRGPRRFRTVSVLKAPQAHCGWFCLKSFINCNINLLFLFVCLFEGKKCGLFSSKKPKEPRMALNLTRSLYGEVTSEDRP